MTSSGPSVELLLTTRSSHSVSGGTLSLAKPSSVFRRDSHRFHVQMAAVSFSARRLSFGSFASLDPVNRSCIHISVQRTARRRTGIAFSGQIVTDTPGGGCGDTLLTPAEQVSFLTRVRWPARRGSTGPGAAALSRWLGRCVHRTWLISTGVRTASRPPRADRRAAAASGARRGIRILTLPWTNTHPTGQVPAARAAIDRLVG